MKKVCLFLLLLPCICGYARHERGLIGNIKAENYPEVSFVWNDRDPNPKNKSRFELRQNNEPLEFGFKHLPKSNADIPNKNRYILFLWEDMAIHGNSGFIRKLLTDFLNGTTLASGDKFNVAIFNRYQEVKLLNENFTSDVKVLSREVNNHVASRESFPNPPQFIRASRLFWAVTYGLDLLKNEMPDGNIGAIVVITVGLNASLSGNNDHFIPVNKALEYDIPVYAIKWSAVDDRTDKNIDNLVPLTFGQVSAPNEVAIDRLRQFYNEMNRRHYGNDYEFTFTPVAKRNFQSHKIELWIDNNKARDLNLDVSFSMWIKENQPLFIILIVSLLVLIAALTWWIIDRNKKRKEKIAEEIAEAERKAREAKRIAAEAKAAAEALEQEIKDKVIADEKNAQEEAERKELERLLNLMSKKNMFPRLQCVAGNDIKNYTIQKPVTTIGRSSENDIVLSEATVSRYHARIVFDGGGFEIINISETSKPTVNRQPVEQTTLRSGDIIGLGKANITFYL